MSRPLKLTVACLTAIALAVVVSGCGHQKLGIPLTPGTADVHHGAVLFSERCAGCHTFAYAGTHGSAANVRTAQYNNGPDFDIRCERPIARVLYAIENGGFSGAIMPQNVVVGQDAIDVAKFVSTYAGSKAPRVPGVTPCSKKSVGSVSAALASAGNP